MWGLDEFFDPLGTDVLHQKLNLLSIIWHRYVLDSNASVCRCIVSPGMLTHVSVVLVLSAFSITVEIQILALELADMANCCAG